MMVDVDWVGLGFEPALFIEDPELLTRLFREAVEDGLTNQMLACANNTHLPVSVLLQAIPSVSMRFSSSHILDPEDDVVYKLASLGNLPDEAVDLLIHEGNYYAIMGVLERPMLTEDRLEQVWKVIENRYHQAKFATREDLTPRLVQNIIHSHSSNVDAYLSDLVANPVLPVELVVGFALGDRQGLRLRALANPKLPTQIMEPIFHRREDGWGALLENPSLPTEAVDLLMKAYVTGREKVYFLNKINLLTHPNLSTTAVWNLWHTTDMKAHEVLTTRPDIPTELLISEFINNQTAKNVWFNKIPEITSYRHKDWKRLLHRFLSKHYGVLDSALPVTWLEEIAKPYIHTPAWAKKGL